MNTPTNPFLEQIVNNNLSSIIMVCKNHKTGLTNYVDDSSYCRKTIFGNYKPRHGCGNKNNIHECITVQQFLQSFPVIDTTFAKE